MLALGAGVCEMQNDATISLGSLGAMIACSFITARLCKRNIATAKLRQHSPKLATAEPLLPGKATVCTGTMVTWRTKEPEQTQALGLLL